MAKYLPLYHVERVTHEQFIHAVIELGMAHCTCSICNAEYARADKAESED